MTYDNSTEEIKNRLSNIGEAIGVIALEYIEKLENENEQLKQQIEKMKCCGNCTHRNAKEVVETCRKLKKYTLNKGFCDKWELAE